MYVEHQFLVSDAYNVVHTHSNGHTFRQKTRDHAQIRFVRKDGNL